MRRPLIPILAALLIGVWLEARLGFASSLFTSAFHTQRLPLPIIVGYMCVLGLWGVLHARHRYRMAALMLCLLAVFIGMSRYALSRYLPLDHIIHVVENDIVTIEGRLYRPIESSGRVVYDNVVPNEYLYVDVTWLEHKDTRYRVRGKIRITVLGSGLLRSEKKSFVYGDMIRTRLRLRLPRNLPNFDYRAYLRRQGIYLLGTLKHDRYIITLPQWKGNPYLAWMYSIRRRIRQFLTSYPALHDPTATTTIQVLQAMTLGTSRELSPELQSIFRNSGLYHVLVVSGIHIGIVAGVLHYLLRACYVPLHYRILGIVPVLVIYAGLSGFQFPTVRAVIMALLFYFSFTCNRVADGLYSLGVAVTILLLIFPGAVFEVSFQMTVAATASILVFYRCCMRTRWWGTLQHAMMIIRIPLMSLLVTCGAMLGIVPLMVYHFQRFSPYSIISNLAAFFFITPLLPFALLLEFLSLIVPWKFVYPVFSLTILLGRGLIWVAGLFPPFPVIFPRFRPLTLWIYYSMTFGGMVFFLRRKADRGHSP